jgi:hypothetical protein
MSYVKWSQVCALLGCFLGYMERYWTVIKINHVAADVICLNTGRRVFHVALNGWLAIDLENGNQCMAVCGRQNPSLGIYHQIFVQCLDKAALCAATPQCFVCYLAK